MDNGKRPVDKLTARERATAQLIAQGKTNKEAALVLRLTSNTISAYLQRIFSKTGCWDRVELATYVRDHPDIFNVLPVA